MHFIPHMLHMGEFFCIFAPEMKLLYMEDKGEIVIYQTQDGTTQLDVRLDGETVWITQE